MRQVHINFIGIDGSGKTSLSNRIKYLLKGESCIIWCGAESLLMWPVRYLAKLIIAITHYYRNPNSKPQRVNRASGIDDKRRFATALPIATRMYIALVMLDYRLQYTWKIWLARKYRYVILDRYFFDVAVNLAVRLGWSSSQLIEFIEENIHLFNFPSARIWISIAPELSMQRKTDIPDIEYLNCRLQYYKDIAETFGFLVIEGSNDIKANEYIVMDYLKRVEEMNLILYVHSNNDDVGGADSCLYRMANELNVNNFHVLCALRIRNSMSQDYHEAGLPVFRKKFSRPQLSRGGMNIALMPFKLLWDILYFVFLFRRQRPELVHVNDLYDFAPAISAKLTGVPLIYHIRMIRTNKVEVKFFAFLINLLASKSVSVSNAVKETYFPTARNFHANSKHIVIHDWPSDDFITDTYTQASIPQGMSSKGINVVMVGRLEPWKGQHIFIEAVEKVNSKLSSSYRVNYYLVGGIVKGRSKEAYANEIVSRVDLADNITYLGHRADIANILAHADISVHASVNPDPFPGVVLESLLAGCATIAADSGGATEIIRNAMDGLLFHPSDSDDLAKGLTDLILSKEYRSVLAENGRERVIELTEKHTIVKQLNNLYTECIANG